MQNPPVHWSEGMFLRPHHFQASDRFWAENVVLNSHFDHPYGYGVYQMDIAPDALANGVLRIVGLKARMRDGTVLSHSHNHVLSVELASRLDMNAIGNQPVTVYLGLPVMSDGRPNVSISAENALSRFTEIRRDFDDHSTGGNRQQIGLLQLNSRVLFSTEDLAGFEVIPIMRLIRAASDDTAFQVDPNYIPPCITTQSWGDLNTLLNEIRNFIGSRIKTLSSIARDKGITLSTQIEGDLEKILLLHVLNEAYGELSCLVYATGVHPFVAYTALCAIVGRCSIFGPTMAIEELPRYDHDDLDRIFRSVILQIRKLVNSVKDDECIQRYFVGAGKGMHVALEPEWFGPEWDWYFGVNPVNFSVEQCGQLLRGGIDWILGASDKVEQYMTLRQPGLKLRPDAQLPRALSNRGGKWVFYQIRLEGEPWNQVRVSQTMGMRVRTEQISNLDSLEGNRRLHVTVNGQAYGLEFAIFASKKRM